MKAEEFRIGNLVFDNLGGTLKINGIKSESDLSHIKPIPLTEEWLVKAGFEITGRKQFKSSPIRFLKWSYGNEFWVEDNSYDTLLEVENIKYVHQLQNLYFALTGTELTFN